MDLQVPVEIRPASEDLAASAVIAGVALLASRHSVRLQSESNVCEQRLVPLYPNVSEYPHLLEAAPRPTLALHLGAGSSGRCGRTTRTGLSCNFGTRHGTWLHHLQRTGTVAWLASMGAFGALIAGRCFVALNNEGGFKTTIKETACIHTCCIRLLRTLYHSSSVRAGLDGVAAVTNRPRSSVAATVDFSP